MKYFQFHLGDYSSATQHLSWDEDMAYHRLLEVYYRHESPLPLDRRLVYRLTRATTEVQREAVDVVLVEFFEETERGWINRRCDAEIADFRAGKFRDRG